MSLTEQEKTIIRESFGKVAPESKLVAEIFYARLWEIDPESRSLFKNTNMVEQGRKLMQTLAFVFGGLHDIESILPAVRDLGRRHIGYGIRKEQYSSVGLALIWALETKLGEAFTAEVKEAWLKVYTLLVSAATSAYES